MLGATLYLVGLELPEKTYVENASSCSMCKRMVINAGIATVIIRRTADEYTVVDVNDWVVHDESIHGVKGY